MPKLLTLTFVIVGSAAICPHPVMALRFSAPTPKFNYTDPSGKKQSVEVVDKYYPKKIVQPIAKADAQIDPKLRRAATIAEERARAHSLSKCWHFVKEALVAAGVVKSRPQTPACETSRSGAGEQLRIQKTARLKSVRSACGICVGLRRQARSRSCGDPHRDRIC